MSKWCATRPSDIIDPYHEEIEGTLDRFMFDLEVIGSTAKASTDANGGGGAAAGSAKAQFYAQKEEFKRSIHGSASR